MIQIATPNLLGRGIYTPRQAARYARLQTQTLARWIHGQKGGAAAVRAELEDDPDRFVTFLDLVQAMAIRAIRLERKISLQRIRDVVDKAEMQYGVTYPFARKHQTYLFDDDIVLRVESGEMIQLTGKYHDHQCIHPVIEIYGDDLGYDPDTGLAKDYKPWQVNGREVKLDPKIRFGEPIVYPANVSVDALVSSVRTEGSVEAAALVHDVDREDVVAAQRYDDWLMGVAG